MSESPILHAGQKFLSIKISHDNERLFELDKGLQLLALLSDSIPFGAALTSYRSNTPTSYQVSFLDASDLSEIQINRLLGQHRTQESPA